MSVGKHAARRLLLHGDEDSMVTASAAIKIWDLSTRTSSRKLRGHAAAVVCMTYSSHHRFLVSASSDRFILVWSTAGDSADPLVTLTLDAAPVQLCMRASSGEQQERGGACEEEVLAVSEAGAIAIWRFNPLLHQGAAPLASAGVTASAKKKKEKEKEKGNKASPATTPRDVRPLTPHSTITPGTGIHTYIYIYIYI
jgi:WD40 repeat protein